MNIFRTIFGFISDDPRSMRLDAVERRVRKQIRDVGYLTIADGKREMRGDVERLRKDFHRVIIQASKNDQKSRTK